MDIIFLADNHIIKADFEKNEELFVDQPAKDLFEEYESEVKRYLGLKVLLNFAILEIILTKATLMSL